MSTRRAFTLTELLVVIAIIALLVTLLIPNIRTARTPALKNSCRNNIKQIALAFQNHNDTFKTFPPLYFTNEDVKKANPALSPKDAADYYSWQMRLLPFIEEDTLYKSVSKASNKFTIALVEGQDSAAIKRNRFAGMIQMSSSLVCPSNSQDIADGTSNYVALSSTRLRSCSISRKTKTASRRTSRNPTG